MAPIESHVALPRQTAYRPNPGIVWARERDHTRLLDPALGKAWQLTGVEAVIWDLLVLGYRCPRISDLLCALRRLEPNEADGLLRRTLASWRDEGILSMDDG
jgi:hypothetical protein